MSITISDSIGALATLIGVVMTLATINSWKMKARLEKKAETAAKCLVATKRFSAAWDIVFNPGFQTEEELPDAFRRRIASVINDIDGFRNAHFDAVLLDAETEDMFFTLSKMWNRAYRNAFAYWDNPAGSEDRKEAYNNSFGSQVFEQKDLQIEEIVYRLKKNVNFDSK